jgi:hypothetical protein
VYNYIFKTTALITLVKIITITKTIPYLTAISLICLEYFTPEEKQNYFWHMCLGIWYKNPKISALST